MADPAYAPCQLVPVQYRRLNGKVFDSHQYSVTEYFTSSKVRALPPAHPGTRV